MADDLSTLSDEDLARLEQQLSAPPATAPAPTATAAGPDLSRLSDEQLQQMSQGRFPAGAEAARFATGGLSDVLSAGSNALSGWLINQFSPGSYPGSIGEQYQEERARQQQRQQTYEQADPTGATGAKIVGAFGPAKVLGPMLGTSTSLLGQAGAGAATGAVTGGVTAAAESPAPAFSLEQAKDIAKGTGEGAVIGGVLPPALAGVERVMSPFIRPIINAIRPWTESGREQLAGDLLRSDAQISGPEALATIGNPARDVEASSTNAAARLKQARSDAHDAAQNSFANLDPSGQATTDVASLRQAYDGYYAGLPKADRKYLQPGNEFETDLKKTFGDQEPYGELQAFSSNLRTDASSAYNSDPNKGRVLRGLHEALFPEGTPEAIGDATVQQNLAQAKQQWKAYKDTFEKPTLPDGGPNPLAQITGEGRAVGAAPEAALTTILKPGLDQGARVNAFLQVADDDAKAAGRDWVAAQLQQLQSAKDPGAGTAKFVSNNRRLIDSDLFTPEQRATIRGLANPTSPMQAMRLGALPAAANIGAGLALPAAARFFPGHEAGLQELLALGAVGGYSGLKDIGGRAARSLYSGPAQKLTDLMAQARTDPALMARLQAQPPVPGLFGGQFSSPALRVGGAVPAVVQAMTGP